MEERNYACDSSKLCRTGVQGIRFHDITHDDMKNGPGLRVVLWVAACEHHCKGCHNPMTWDPKGGLPLSLSEEEELFSWLEKPWTEGITFSGGDPLHPNNREYIGRMAKDIKERYPDKDIWLYTGYVLQVSEKGFKLWDQDGNTFYFPYLNYIDVLVDGRFDEERRAADIKDENVPRWRGSSNQRIIDIRNSLKSGNIMEWEEERYA